MPMKDVILLKRSEVVELLDLNRCIACVEQALRAHAEGKTLPPGVLGVHSGDGGFHIKAAGLTGERAYFAAKVNSNFPQNAVRFGLPMIQGVIVLSDATNGTPLALLDSMEITILRTGAATAVAAKYLARSDARVATICGCGNQGRVQLRALARVRKLERTFAWDRDTGRAAGYAAEMSRELGFEVRPAADLAQAVRQSDICVTCTPAPRAYLMREFVAPGTFVAGVGADNPAKQELDPALLAASTIVVDHLEQCATLGDLHHALENGAVKRENVHAELHEVVAGRKPGRRSPEEIIVFDSTGTALQDVAAAAAVYEAASQRGTGLRWAIGG